MNRKNLALVVTITVIVAASIAAYILAINRSTAPEGYKKVEGYNHVEPGQATCFALTPSCGYCPGEVIDKACYVRDQD